MELDNWLDYADSSFLTIRDVNNWKIGEKIQIVSFDRNFQEHLENDEISGKIIDGNTYTAEQLFESQKIEITYKGNMKWDINADEWDGIDQHIELNVEKDYPECGWAWLPFVEGGYLLITEWADNENCCTIYLDE